MPAHVIVIGAGATGLLIAQGLKQAGVSFGIYEYQDHETYWGRLRDWSMGLHWGHEFMRTCLPPDIIADLDQMLPDPYIQLTKEQDSVIPLVNGKTGDLVLNIPTLTARRVSRAKIRKLFSRDLPVQYGKALTSITEDGDKVVAHFADGTCAEATTIVGADGGRSSVRSLIFPAAEIDVLPVQFFNIEQKYGAEETAKMREMLHPLSKIALHPDQATSMMLSTLDVPDPEDPSSWIMQVILTHWDPTPVPETSEKRLALFKSLAAPFCEPFKSAASLVKDDTMVYQNHILCWPGISKWNNHGGRVTLAGDAAHPLPPHRGQGLNNAVADAALYVQKIQSLVAASSEGVWSDELSRCIDEYDADVLTRGMTEMKISVAQARQGHYLDALLASPLAKQGMHREVK